MNTKLKERPKVLSYRSFGGSCKKTIVLTVTIKSYNDWTEANKTWCQGSVTEISAEPVMS